MTIIKRSNVVIVRQEMVTEWVIERNATKDNGLEGFPVVGALLGSRAARLPWNASVTVSIVYVKRKERFVNDE
jgi:hypothetical protein